MVSKLKWIITHGASFQIRTEWLDSLERSEWRVAAHNNPDETKVQLKLSLLSVLISLCHVKGLWRYSPLLSSDLCNTGMILVKWDPRNIKSEQGFASKLDQNLTLTTQTATIRVLSKSDSGSCFFYHQGFCEKKFTDNLWKSIGSAH